MLSALSHAFRLGVFMNIFKTIRNQLRKLSKNCLILKSLERKGSVVSYQYQLTGEWKQYFNEKEKFTIDYGVDVSTIPEGVLVIPLLANVLPMSWVCDAEVVINEIEKDFYERLEKMMECNLYDLFPEIKEEDIITKETDYQELLDLVQHPNKELIVD